MGITIFFKDIEALKFTKLTKCEINSKYHLEFIKNIIRSIELDIIYIFYFFQTNLYFIKHLFIHI